MADQLEQDYLARLLRAAERLGPEVQAELLDQIQAHLEEARATGLVHDEASLRQLLDRLGEPAEIVAAADRADDLAPEPAHLPARDQRTGIESERLAFAFMLFGSIALGVGWLIGVIVLWTWCRRLTVGEKVLATLVFPGGPFVSLYFLVGSALVSVAAASAAFLALFLALDLIWLVAPFVVAVVVLRRVRSRVDAEISATTGTERTIAA